MATANYPRRSSIYDCPTKTLNWRSTLSLNHTKIVVNLQGISDMHLFRQIGRNLNIGRTVTTVEVYRIQNTTLFLWEVRSDCNIFRRRRSEYQFHSHCIRIVQRNLWSNCNSYILRKWTVNRTVYAPA